MPSLFLFQRPLQSERARQSTRAYPAGRAVLRGRESAAGFVLLPIPRHVAFPICVPYPVENQFDDTDACDPLSCVLR